MSGKYIIYGVDGLYFGHYKISSKMYVCVCVCTGRDKGTDEKVNWVDTVMY